MTSESVIRASLTLIVALRKVEETWTAIGTEGAWWESAGALRLSVGEVQPSPDTDAAGRSTCGSVAVRPGGGRREVAKCVSLVRPAVERRRARFVPVSITLHVTGGSDRGAAVPVADLGIARPGLRDPSRLMVDKLTTVRRSRLGERLGTLGDADVVRLNRAMVVLLGISASSG